VNKPNSPLKIVCESFFIRASFCFFAFFSGLPEKLAEAFMFPVDGKTVL